MAEPSGFMTDLPQSAYLSLSINRAISAAQQRSHRYVTLEHLIFAMLDDPSATEILEGLRADIPAIRREITETVNRNLATLYAPGEGETRASYKVERVLQSASDDASRLGCHEVDAAFVIAAMSRETDSPGADVLKRNGVAYTSAVTWLYSNRGATFGSRSSQRSKPQPAAPAPVQAAPAPAPAPMPAPAPQPAPRSMGDALARLRVEEHEPVANGTAAEEVDDYEPDLDEDEDEETLSPENGPVAMGRATRVPEKAPPPAPPQPQPAPRPQPVPAAIKRVERIEPRLAPAAPPPTSAAPAPAPVSPPPRRSDPEPVARPQPGFDDRRAEPQLPPSSRLDEMRVRPGGAGAKPRPAPPAPAPAPPPPSAASPAPGAQPRGRSRPAPPPAAPAPAPAAREAPPAAATEGQPVPAGRTGTVRRKPRPQNPIIGRLIENIPRRMRAETPERIEVRISREDTQKLMRGMEGRGEPVRHDISLTQTMSVALRAPDGGFTIEPVSPETQWIFDRPDNAETYGRWRWVVTPHRSGQRRLQLLVAGRTVGQNGVIGDSALPDQLITVRVRVNYLRAIGRGLQWLAALVVGGILTEAALIGLKMFSS